MMIFLGFFRIKNNVGNLKNDNFKNNLIKLEFQK